jgi:hypothetical protein
LKLFLHQKSSNEIFLPSIKSFINVFLFSTKNSNEFIFFIKNSGLHFFKKKLNKNSPNILNSQTLRTFFKIPMCKKGKLEYKREGGRIFFQILKIRVFFKLLKSQVFEYKKGRFFLILKIHRYFALFIFKLHNETKIL